jgi:dTDP-4-dehydrorhamnose 3,5-epimerase
VSFRETRLKGAVEISFSPHTDFRGYLVRSYERDAFADLKIEIQWVQESLSHTNAANTLRGLHVQLPPHPEAKLITAIRGKMRWIIVDLRKGSSTFGAWESVTLSGELHNSLYVGSGFAHGCVSISDDCDLIIKSDQKFGASQQTGIVWNDPTLNIDWGIGDAVPVMSERDRSYPSFDAFVRTFGSL